MPVLPVLLALLAPAGAATVHALVEIRADGMLLLDAVAAPGEARPRSRPALPGAAPVEVRDGRGQLLTSAPIPDPRLRTVILPDGGGASAVLDRVVARVVLDWPEDAETVRLGDTALRPRAQPPGTPSAVIDSGDPTERLDLVFLGDGYTEDELGLFAADVDRITAHLLTIEPYGSYAELFNIWRIDQESAESGASHLESGDIRDTAYGCYYGCGGIDRLVCCNDLAVLSEVDAAIPAADGIIVLVNDPTYGGSGGFEYATSFTDGLTGAQVAAHELGHSLVGLYDEYSYGTATAWPAGPNCAEDPESPPWAAWLGDEGISVHSVCGYTNHHRPTFDGCMMRTLQDGYCAVCREQAVLAIHGALPGLVVSADPAPGELQLQEGEEIAFSVQLIGAEPERWQVGWTLDGVPLGEGTAIAVEGCDSAGALRLEVRDPTPWVRTDPHGLLAEEQSWTLLPCESADTGEPGEETGDPDTARPEPPPADEEREQPLACGCNGGPAGAGFSMILLGLTGILWRRRKVRN